MKNIISFLFIVFCLSCQKEQPARIKEGIYGLSELFVRKKFNFDYNERLILDIRRDSVYLYELVVTWGRVFEKRYNTTGDTLYLSDLYKIYHGSTPDNTIILEPLRPVNSFSKPSEFTKLNSLDSVIDKTGINVTSLGKYLQEVLIAGKYMYKGMPVELTKEERAINFPTFSNYKIWPRTGTSWRYDSNNIIIADEQAYRYEIKIDSLILTKYLQYHDEWEVYNVSDERYVLTRL